MVNASTEAVNGAAGGVGWSHDAPVDALGTTVGETAVRAANEAYDDVGVDDSLVTISRVDFSGAVIEDWTTPGSPRVTCPLLFEHGGHVRLVLTTATEGMPEDQRTQCPNAGNLFWAETSFASVPAGEIVRLS